MNAFLIYLWKEWRDQRMTVLGIIAVQFLLCLLLVLFLPDTVLGSTGLVSGVTLGSLALTLVVFGPELIGGEIRSGTLGYLSRMPSGLHLAFAAKALFLLLSLFGLFCSGYLISIAFHVVVGKDWGGSVPPLLFDDWVVPGALTAGLLMMAVSSWLPRSILTVPATAMLVALILLPCYLVLGQNDTLVSYLRVESCLSFAPPLALAILWLSLARGRRAGGGPGSSARCGLSACVLAALPLWSWVGYWVHEWETPEPHEEIQICCGFMGKDGQLAFLNTYRRPKWPWMGLVVNLETGAWHQIGELNDGFRPVRLKEPVTYSEFGEHLIVRQIRDPGSWPHSTWHPVAYVETATGDVIEEDSATFNGFRVAMRKRTPIRMPDGRRVWMLNGNLEVETANGGFESLPWDRRDTVNSVIGYGLSVYTAGQRAVYDLARKRRFDDRFEDGCCWVLGSRWLIGDANRNRDFRNWRLLDPETRESETASGMLDGDRVIAILDDGSVLVQARDPQSGLRSHIVDIPSSTRTPLTVPGLETTDWSLWENRVPRRSSDGRRLFIMMRSDRAREHLTSLAPGSNTLTPPVPLGRVLGCPDAGTALIISPNRRSLERIDLVTGESETVFPQRK